MKSKILTILLVLSIIVTCTITVNKISAAGSYNIVVTASTANPTYGENVTVEFELKDITVTPRNRSCSRKNRI